MPDRRISIPDQQTFSQKHLDRLFNVFAGSVGTEDMGILYRASYSNTFAADLRALLEEVVKPEVVTEWEHA